MSVDITQLINNSTVKNSTSTTTAADTAAQKADANKLAQKDFLNLMMAQLKNQDPLNPQDGGQFLAQLAQFSTVDGIQGLQGSVDSMASSLQSNQALQASALVGRKVEVQSKVADLPSTGNIDGNLQLDAAATNVTVKVTDSTGKVVNTLTLGSVSQGRTDFTWDGNDSNGQRAPAGTYTLTAEGSVAGQNTAFNTYLYANVNSVSLGTGSAGLTLNLAGVGAVPFSKVTVIK